jgi:PAS domain S-box-containing protein
MNEIDIIPNSTSLRTALDVVHEAVIAVDNEEIIVLFNEGSEKIFGFSNAEVIGKHIDILFLGSVQDILQQNKDVVCMGTSSFNDTEQAVDLVGQNKNGTLFLCKLLIKRDINSLNTIITVSLSEVCRIRRENNLKESEIRYRRLFESAKDGILILDAKTGMIDDVNPYLINMLGYTKEDFIEKKIWDIVPFKDIVANKEKFSDLQKNDYVRYDDLPLETINGKKVYVEFISNVYLVNNEKVIQCNIRDISVRKNAQADLFEKDIQYRNLANSGVALIWTMDTNKMCNYFNQSWLKFTGRTLEQELGNGWIDGIHRDDLDKCMAVFNSAFDKRETFDVEYRLKKANGKYAWLRDLGTPNFDSRHEFAGYIGHCFDISDIKNTEKELVIARDKAEESDKLKTTFLQNMSHEIRTPLNGIIGFSKLLNSENLNNQDIKEFTNIIITSGYRLIEIVNNILDISKIQTGQISVDLQPVLLNDVFSELHSFFQLNASDNKIDLCFDNGVNDTTILTDETKLRQVLTNLINNSIKFTHSGKINFGFNVFETHIIFYVKDTGIGIPYENHEKVFERFVQSEQSLSRNYEGAGLGLAICKGLVELLGGRIWLDSTHGKGTKISFTLPNTLDNDITK